MPRQSISYELRSSVFLDVGYLSYLGKLNCLSLALQRLIGMVIVHEFKTILFNMFSIEQATTPSLRKKAGSDDTGVGSGKEPEC